MRTKTKVNFISAFYKTQPEFTKLQDFSNEIWTPLQLVLLENTCMHALIWTGQKKLFSLDFVIVNGALGKKFDA